MRLELRRRQHEVAPKMLSNDLDDALRVRHERLLQGWGGGHAYVRRPDSFNRAPELCKVTFGDPGGYLSTIASGQVVFVHD